jgi:hypothetical protein
VTDCPPPISTASPAAGTVARALSFHVAGDDHRPVDVATYTAPPDTPGGQPANRQTAYRTETEAVAALTAENEKNRAIDADCREKRAQSRAWNEVSDICGGGSVPLMLLKEVCGEESRKTENKQTEWEMR